MDKIGIVTITYNSESVISSFLNCVLSQDYKNFILYIIDNNSKDSTINLLYNYNDSRIKLIKNKKNVGVAKANNQGIKAAISSSCDQILLINNDVEFDNDLILELVKAQVDCKSSLIVPKIMYHHNKNLIWYAGSFFSIINGFLPVHRGFRKEDNEIYDQIAKVHYAPTCCILIKKVVFEDIGFMDEKYFVYFDDTDFCYRVKKNNHHSLVYYPKVKLYHKVGSLTSVQKLDSETNFKSDFFLQQNIKNHIYFLRKMQKYYSYFFMVFLFFRYNLKFFFSKKIKKNFKTFILINRSFFEGFKIKR